MRIDRLIPLKKESSVGGVVTTANDVDYFSVRGCQFDPYNAPGVATLKSVLYYAAVAGIATERLAKIEDDEKTGFQNYIVALWTYLQSNYAQANIRRYCPVLVNKFTDTDKDIWILDSWEHELDMGSLQNLPSCDWLEEIVREMNPICILQEPFEPQETPGMYHAYWAPSLTTTEAQALRGVLFENSHHFTMFCKRAGLSIKQMNLRDFVTRDPIKFHALDFKDYRWLFFASSLTVWRRNNADTGPAKILPTYYTQAQEGPTDDAEWIDTWFYIIPDGGLSQPHAFVAILPLMQRYHANNLLGCAEHPTDGILIGKTADPAANYLYIARVARADISGGGNADSLEWVVDDDLSNYIPVYFYNFTDNTTYGLDKEMGDSQYATFSELRTLTNARLLRYDKAIWDTDGSVFSKERSFFRAVMRGVVTKRQFGKVDEKVSPKGGKAVKTARLQKEEGVGY